MKMNELVAKYVQLRDKKSQLKAEYEASAKKLTDVMDKIEAALLGAFDTAGLDSVKTEAGTAYTATRVSATVADKDAFMRHVREHDDWQLTDIRCSKAGVEQYKDAHEGEIPPGINWREERVVNIRRA